MNSRTKPVFRLALLALCALFVRSACAQLPAGGTQSADSYFDRVFSAKEAQGAAVVAARGGTVLYEYYYGRRSAANGEPVTRDTLFRVASVTKMVSAVGVMQLVEDGRIGLDEPLGDYYGHRVENPKKPGSPITLRQVLSHTSSLAKEAGTRPNWSDLNKSRRYFTKYAPGTRYEYSNLNGGLLGSVIELVSGMSVDAYMKKNVFGPLGIDAGYSAGLIEKPVNLSALFNEDGTLYLSAEDLIGQAAGYDDTCDPLNHCERTVGSLLISAEGLARLASALCEGGKAGGPRLLEEETALAMRQDQQGAFMSTVLCQSGYGLGLERFGELTGPGYEWYGHQGRWEGLVANVLFQPDRRLALVLICNGSDVVLRDRVNKTAVDAAGYFWEMPGIGN